MHLAGSTHCDWPPLFSHKSFELHCHACAGIGYAANSTDAHMPPIRPTCRRSTCHACAGVGCATERSEAMADKRNACAVVGQAPAGCEGETPLASCLRGRRLGVQKT